MAKRRTEIDPPDRPKIIFGVHEICRYCRGAVKRKKNKPPVVGCGYCEWTGFVEIKKGESWRRVIR